MKYAIVQVEPTDKARDSVRGVMQAIRVNPGVTMEKVRAHCQMRGDDLSLWPSWTTEVKGYVTESLAADLVFSIMLAARPALDGPMLAAVEVAKKMLDPSDATIGLDDALTIASALLRAAGEDV